jgi:hypothetical protein
MAWAQLGRYCDTDCPKRQLVLMVLRAVPDYESNNLVLLKLVEYLGNTNNVVSAFAFNEVGAWNCILGLC